MKDTEFFQIINDAMAKHPFWFEGVSENEKVSIDEIKEIEILKKITYPEEYKKFMSNYGAGDFAFTNVYSPKFKGEMSSWEQIEKYNIPELFIPISDNGCGDYLGFKVDGGMCSEALFWSDHEQGYEISNKAAYESFYSFIVNEGLNT